MTRKHFIRPRVEAGRRVPRRGTAPLISVVVASTGTPRQLAGCLAALEPQRSAVLAELVIVRSDHPSRLAELTAGAPDAKLVAAPNGSTVGQLRALGLAAAAGDIVAITEDDRAVPADWLDALSWRVRGDRGAEAAGRVHQPSDVPARIAHSRMADAARELAEPDAATRRGIAAPSLADTGAARMGPERPSR